MIENNGILHNHYSKWIMNVDIDYFYANSKNTQINADIVRERNGAHEFGHILGLRDVDNNCSASNSTNHHQDTDHTISFCTEDSLRTMGL